MLSADEVNCLTYRVISSVLKFLIVSVTRKTMLVLNWLSVCAAKPKVANYPFTTLVPNLGVCEMNYRTTVFADIPGQALLRIQEFVSQSVPALANWHNCH